MKDYKTKVQKRINFLKKKKKNCKSRRKEYKVLTIVGLAGTVYGVGAVHYPHILTAGIGFTILGSIGIYSTYKERKRYNQEISELEKKLE